MNGFLPPRLPEPRKATLVDVDDLLRRRAEALADPGTPEDVEPTVPLLISVAGPHRVGLELPAVAHVFPAPRITPIPGSPYPLLGVANIRGTVRSVLSLRRLLQMHEDDTVENNLLLLRWGDQQRGLLVDRVQGIRQFSQSDFAALAEVPPSFEGCGVRGIVDGVLLLQTHQLFQLQTSHETRNGVNEHEAFHQV